MIFTLISNLNIKDNNFFIYLQENCRWTAFRDIPSNFDVEETCQGEEFLAGIVRQEETM